MFGRIYFLALGMMLFLVGTMLSFAGSIAADPCAKISDALSRAPQGIPIAFNPCSIYANMPGASILLQALGIAIAAFVLFLMAKGASKEQPACPKCKQALPEKSRFCPKCGTKLADQEKEK